MTGLDAEAHREAIKTSFPHLMMDDKPKSFTFPELEAWLVRRGYTKAKLLFDRVKVRELVEITLPTGDHRTLTLREILTEMENETK